MLFQPPIPRTELDDRCLFWYEFGHLLGAGLPRGLYTVGVAPSLMIRQMEQSCRQPLRGFECPPRDAPCHGQEPPKNTTGSRYYITHVVMPRTGTHAARQIFW